MGYIFTELWRINDAGECGGYANVASSLTRNKQAVRFTDGPVWRAFNAQPTRSANVMGLAATGDTAFHLGAGAAGSFVHVEGYGSIALQSTLSPAYSHWDLGGSIAPIISRGGRVVCTGVDTSSGRSGFVLLTPQAFDDLGGGTLGQLGRPVLTGYGPLAPSAPTRLRLAGAPPTSPAFLAFASRANPVAVFGGVFHPDLSSVVVVPLTTDGLGQFDRTFAWSSAPVGTTYYLQAGSLDTTALFGVTLSNAMAGTTR